MSVTDHAQINGVSYGSGQNFTGEFGSVTAASFDNSGLFNASDNAAQSGIFTLGSLTNQGTGIIQSKKDLIFDVANSFTNNGKIIALNDLTTAAGTSSILSVINKEDGIVQASGLLTVKGKDTGANTTINNQAGTLLGVNKLSLKISSLTNSDILQGGMDGALLDITNGLTNSGKVITDGALTINANIIVNTSAGSVQGTNGSTVAAASLDNSGLFNASDNAGYSGAFTLGSLTNQASGIIQSEGGLNINTDSFNNFGKTLSAGNIIFRGKTGGAYALNSYGRIQSGGLLNIGDGANFNVNIGSTGVILGGSAVMNATSLTIADGGMISSMQDMNLQLGTLQFQGSSSRIVAATNGGSATVSLLNSFSNIGAVHSGGNLNFTAPSIINSNIGGFSALNTLALNASSGSLNNAGALYAGSILNASSTEIFTNQASTGNINSGGNVNLNAVTFINQGEINAAGSISITATTFKNLILYGDTREWYKSAESLDQTVGSRDWYDFPDDFEATYKKSTWTMSQRYKTPLPTVKPHIIAGNTLTIQGFSSGENIGGFISGGTVNLIGTGTFTNSDLPLNRKDYIRTWTLETKYIALGPITYYRNRTLDDSTAMTESVISTAGAGILAGYLNASGFDLINKGAPLQVYVSSTKADGTSSDFLANGVVGVAAANGGTAILIIKLPTNPNGYFVLNVNSNADYLVEVNPLFGVGADFVGSQYMGRRYGYDPDDTIKRLGDANYEAFLIRQQLIRKTGSNLLGGYASEAEQMKGFMEAGLSSAKKLKLEYGKAPTSEQFVKLEEDIVWMVEIEVKGQKVLAPVVYLAQSTKDSVQKGAVIAANNINMDLASLTNIGGTISGDNALNITKKILQT